MILLCCGSRHWTSRDVIFAKLQEIDQTVYYKHVPMTGRITLLIHGAAKGADTIADEWAAQRNVRRAPFPAIWERDGKYDPGAGPKRNQRMLVEGKPDLVVAFRMPGVSKGTDDMIARATRAGVRVEIVHG